MRGVLGRPSAPCAAPCSRPSRVSISGLCPSSASGRVLPYPTRREIYRLLAVFLLLHPEGGSAVPASGTGAANMLKGRVMDLDVEYGDLLSHQGYSSFPFPCAFQVHTSASRRYLCVSFCRVLDL